MGKEKNNKIEKEKKDNKKIEKKVKNNTEKKKESKISKKTIIIVVLSVLVVILACIVGWFVYRNNLENKTTGSDWSDKYYNFLRDQNKKKDINSTLTEESELSFVKDEQEKYPYMLVKKEYEENGKKRESISMFAIDEGKVKYINGYNANKVDVKLYYNVDRKEYNYYLHTINDTFEDYYSLYSIKYDYDNYNVYKTLEEKGIKDVDSEEAMKIKEEFRNKRSNDENIDEYFIYDEDKKVEQKTLDGKTIEYNKMDEKLVDTKVEPKYFDYKKNMSPINLRKEVVKGHDDYKDVNELLDKAIKKMVKEQLDMIEKTKQDIENAKAEIKADEERKSAEAEAALYAAGLKVGENTLKFGKYTTSVQGGGPNGGDLYGTIILNPNGKFHIKTNFEQSSGDARNIDEDGTYRVGTAINSYDTQPAIHFTTNSGYKFTYYVVNDTYMNSQWIIYNYSGN